MGQEGYVTIAPGGSAFFVRVTHEQTPRKIAACFTFVYLIFIRIYKKKREILLKNHLIM